MSRGDRRPTPFAHCCADGVSLVGDRLEGRGPGYLYLHGLGAAHVGGKSDSLVAHALARGERCLRIDLRGHGGSGGVLGEVPVRQLAADVVELLLRCGPLRLVGSSLGGLVAALAAAARPELVPAVALVAPAFGLLPRLHTCLDAAGRMRTSEGRWFVVAPAVLAEARALDEAALARSLPMPVFAAHGDADDVIPIADCERFVAAIPHADKAFWRVAGGDHRLTAVAPELWQRFDRFVAARGA